MRRIGVVVKYTEKLDEILIDYSMNLDISHIREKPIRDWFEKSQSRVKWNGLIEEIRQKLRDDNVKLAFEFKGNEKKKKEFEDILRTKEYEQICSNKLSSEEIAERNAELAEKEKMKGDYAAAFRHYLLAAEDGNAPEYQYLVADAYRNTSEKNECPYPIQEKASCAELAFRFYKMSADNKYEKAYSYLGDCYFYGRGTKENRASAFKYYDLAEKSGDKRTDSELGECYYNGYGTSKDYKKAFRLFMDSHNDHRLMECYFYGRGVTKDYSKAYECFCRTDSGGDPEVENKLGEIFDPLLRSRDDSVPRSAYNAFRLYDRAAGQGNCEAQDNLGRCYEYGVYALKNEKTAFELYEKSAEAGCAKGQYDLARCYEKGMTIARQKSCFSVSWRKKYHLTRS